MKRLNLKTLNLKTLTAALAVAVSVALPAAAQEASGPILFTNVNVFDGVNEALIKNANVVVTGNKITAVSTKPLGRRRRQGDRRWRPYADAWPDRLPLAQHGSQYSGDVFAAGEGKLNLVAAHGAEKTLMRGFTSSQGPGRSRIRAKRGDRRGSVRWSPDLRCRCDDLPNVGPCRFP